MASTNPIRKGARGTPDSFMIQPTTPRISETGSSKGMIRVLPIRSQTVTMAMPSRHTQGRLLRMSSPRTMETMLGTISPRKGRFPTTTVTTPVATAISPVPTMMSRS